MSEDKSKKNQHNLPKLEAVDRIMNLPVVESGLHYAGQIYGHLKDSNNVLHWAFGQAETSLNSIVNKTAPAVMMLQAPISALDKILCQSLNIVEKKVPAITLPPERIYHNTKQYVNEVGTKIVHPILKRADSVKKIGNSVLENKYTGMAAEKLDGALNAADKYVDKYLIPANEDVIMEEKQDASVPQTPSRKALKTIHHMDALSRKLQRRLTQLTLAEAKVLRQHSSEAIHVLVYIVELIAKDPKLALQKSKELWASLSKDEPENQARPENLEELVILIVRETARRLVHFINYTTSLVDRLPRQAQVIVNHCLHTIDDLMKMAHIEGLSQIIFEVIRFQAQKITVLLQHLNVYTRNLLEHVSQNADQQDQNTPATSRLQQRDRLRHTMTAAQKRKTPVKPMINGI